MHNEAIDKIRMAIGRKAEWLRSHKDGGLTISAEKAEGWIAGLKQALAIVEQEARDV